MQFQSHAELSMSVTEKTGFLSWATLALDASNLSQYLPSIAARMCGFKAA